ncbi:hypothetical protein PENTCL1PPCAC_19203 [Pristionchus entomophagus]|uniref:Ribosomal protein n=1 Tax=Pristionchus entomophagus TaxID=358040 RepID=A0AAV5TS19_9BILA|nr:hypothetical protein PENTCL1PPCAC_19203 [Pristionchus entomophagus]
MVITFLKMDIGLSEILMAKIRHILWRKGRLSIVSNISQWNSSRRITLRNRSTKMAFRRVMHQLADIIEMMGMGSSGLTSNPAISSFRAAIERLTDGSEKKAVEQTEKEKKKEMKSVPTTANNNFGEERVLSIDRLASVYHEENSTDHDSSQMSLSEGEAFDHQTAILSIMSDEKLAQVFFGSSSN